jgi:hypothetical protein
MMRRACLAMPTLYSCAYSACLRDPLWKLLNKWTWPNRTRGARAATWSKKLLEKVTRRCPSSPVARSLAPTSVFFSCSAKWLYDTVTKSDAAVISSAPSWHCFSMPFSFGDRPSVRGASVKLLWSIQT